MMLDNPVEVDTLMRKMEDHVPIPVRVTNALVRSLRGSEVRLPSSRRVEIESVLYLGDEGSIACVLKIPESENPVIVSLTHLRLNGSHPLAQDIRAYQIRRTRALAQGQ
jgi:hypothetical protein